MATILYSYPKQTVRWSHSWPRSIWTLPTQSNVSVHQQLMLTIKKPHLFRDTAVFSSDVAADREAAAEYLAMEPNTLALDLGCCCCCRSAVIPPSLTVSPDAGMYDGSTGTKNDHAVGAATAPLHWGLRDTAVKAYAAALAGTFGLWIVTKRLTSVSLGYNRRGCNSGRSRRGHASRSIRTFASRAYYDMGCHCLNFF
jgi:hypothetical protein